MECGGCRSGQGIRKDYNQSCRIYNCSKSKDRRICLECAEFPCKLFGFFKAEKLESSSWFLDNWSNMKLIKEKGLKNFLAERESWLDRRRECPRKREVKYCDKCDRWPCELLKRPALIPASLKEFRSFMKKIEK